MGSVITGKHHLSISTWAMYPQRASVLDWCPSHYYTSTILVMKNRPSKFDFAFYLRPFNSQSWFAILSFICALLLIILIPYKWNNNYDRTDSCFIMKTSGWYFFLLLSSFYGGSLTSYFASKTNIPFSSTKDVINAHPGKVSMAHKTM